MGLQSSEVILFVISNWVLLFFIGFYIAMIGSGCARPKIERIGYSIAFFIMPILGFILMTIILILWGISLFFGFKVV